MSAKIINGKEVAKQVKNEIKAEVAEFIDNEDKAPHLVAIIVGEDPASQTYVASKERAAKGVGITSSVYKYPKETTEVELLEAIDFINRDDEIDGVIVQLPLPDQINVNRVIESIDPSKDVDGFHPLNVGKMSIGQETFVSATPAGVMELLKRNNIKTEGKHCVVLGRSNIVGAPLSMLMSKKTDPGNSTVTICHSRTKNLKEITQQADILICAIGVPQFVKPDMVKDGAVVIDVGIHRIPADNEKGYRLVGDVDYEGVSEKASAITPVPGGVGPMTIAMLLKNTLQSFKQRRR
ncbi:MAG: bifunctional methylenetetrahydrofolate dehydrogenase/methenyltetrahydrofolate cyclohydrolase FolD [Lentimicrobiaceae bacterium]|jgi:methylenetetrahydrofolate dehydrogenase (NADP+)/methenyltetrahydrofolate cyclohydrolase|nr:bifunctional methylenetetrahydrofolate dehydrogenase/methenyltetrahydrofolate cyclohydrolase FolD [Lentimicrobiaceae bacterium]MCP4910813.1 bifunctional methylenetetrahydrofolate dehydrogenase/methenyltetrahydrofolate cyclohydrolase FolD [Bacteroidota bacterium]MBT3455267.1 bifunctional methylenetetrahydrofolate dehydrogenase/methenyltetrahydrofolate cyclohydrolase FolD [Lentimicrobiaceae bacterium]MBT3817733.1 bifunctional methylenetetrahydrofolate dehydrogenase/methenyltetrahydrofolate cycl